MRKRTVVLSLALALSALLLAPLGATLPDPAFQLSFSDLSQDEASLPRGSPGNHTLRNADPFSPGRRVASGFGIRVFPPWV